MSSAAKQQQSRKAGALVAKMAAVMKSVKRIPKRGVVNGAGESYETTTAGDVFDAVREEMASQGVILVGRPTSTEITDIDVVCKFAFEWTDGEESLLVDEVTVRVLEKRAASDKAIQSAFTSAHKMVVMSQFLMSSESDGQKDAEPARESKKEIVTGQLTEIKKGNYKAGEAPFLWAKIDGVSYICPEKPAEYLNEVLSARGFTSPIRFPIKVSVQVIQNAGAKHPRIVSWEEIVTQEADRG